MVSCASFAAVLVAPLHAAAAPATYPLAELALSSGRWQSFNQTVNASGPQVVGPPAVVLTGSGVMAAFGVNASGGLEEYANDQVGGRAWNAYDLSAATLAPAVVGRPSVATFNGAPRVAYRGSDNHLWLLSLDQRNGRPWNAYDLSLSTGIGSVRANPSIDVDASGILRVATVDAKGNVELVAHDQRGGRAWNVYKLGLVTDAATSAGSPLLLTDGKGVHRIFYRSDANHLLQLADDHRSTTIWSLRDLTVERWVAFDADPSATVVGGAPVLVGTHGGHLIELLGGSGWRVIDRSADAAELGAAIGRPDILDTGAGSYSILLRGANAHLLKASVGSPGATSSLRDLSTQAAVMSTVASDPSAVLVDGEVHVFVGLGSAITPPPPPPPVDTISTIAISQDQRHAAVAENPLGSNCNPYSGFFKRGNAKGCVPGSSAEAWCSDFAQWVWLKVGGIDTSGISGWSFTFVTYGQQHGTFKRGPANNPAVGDAVVWGDWASSYGSHVGLVTGVRGSMIKVTSGNAGPAYDASGNVVRVWTSDWFDPATSSTGRYPILGYTSPASSSGSLARATAPVLPEALINSQDGGR